MELMEAGVSADGLTARVRIDAKLGAADLEETIERLIACRAAMAPTRFARIFPGSRILVGSGVHRQTQDGKTLICVFHPGLGWVGAEE